MGLAIITTVSHKIPVVHFSLQKTKKLVQIVIIFVDNYIHLKFSLFSCSFSAFPRAGTNYISKYLYFKTISVNSDKC